MQQSQSEDIRHIPFEDLLKQCIDLPVFRLPDGTVSKNIHQTFRKFVTDAGLITCPRTGQNRTLYSLRHTYATFALLNDGMDIHALAIQMGTSIGMIERHYSHLTPRLKKDMLTGKRYELSEGKWQEMDGKAHERICGSRHSLHSALRAAMRTKPPLVFQKQMAAFVVLHLQ